MKQYLTRNYLFVIVAALSLTSCEGCIQHNYAVGLTTEENEFKNQLSKQYNCEVSMAHDDGAVPDNRKDGTFGISLEFSSVKNTDKNLCQKDSLFLDSVSQRIAKNAYSILSHKANYIKISIIYLTEKHTNENMSTIDCSKDFEILTKNLK